MMRIDEGMWKKRGLVSPAQANIISTSRVLLSTLTRFSTTAVVRTYKATLEIPNRLTYLDYTLQSHRKSTYYRSILLSEDAFLSLYTIFDPIYLGLVQGPSDGA